MPTKTLTKPKETRSWSLRRLTTEEFVERAKAAHGDRYDYSKTVYTNAATKIMVICKVHGEFLQLPAMHCKSAGCQQCPKIFTPTLTNAQFASKAQKVHGHRYDYSLVQYVKSDVKVDIGCTTHGVFAQTPFTHLQGSGCRECAREAKMLSMAQFLEKAKALHGDKYDYSKVEYTGAFNKITIVCKEHGEFEQTATLHIKKDGKGGCWECFLHSARMSHTEFIERAKKTHGDTYCYEKTVFVGYKTKVQVTCPAHGTFEQDPQHHLKGSGCTECYHQRQRITQEEFMAKAREVHGDKYDYSRVEYVSAGQKVTLVCTSHGEFLQTPLGHMSGRGCQQCAYASLLLTQREFLESARRVHGDRYDYSKTVYVRGTEKLIVTCKEHGDFNPTAQNHLLGHNCPGCASHGFNPHRQAWLYLMRREGEQQVGITHNLESRQRTHIREGGWQLMEARGPMLGQTARELEKTVKVKLASNQLLVPGKHENWATANIEFASLDELLKWAQKT